MPRHQPVLLSEVLDNLKPKVGESYLDATAGYGGHAEAIIGRTQAPKQAVLVDRDASAILELEKKFKGQAATIVHSDFLSASQELVGSGKQFELILADLGLSSPQLDESGRGFSVQMSGPLDMRMDKRQESSASQIINEATREELEAMFATFGEEPKAAQIADEIVRQRPLKTTDQLARIAAKFWPGYSRRHPATRVFQAIRIAVNNELYQLEQSLPLWLELLAPGGRLAIISFHSLEDRLVKQFFTDNSASNYTGQLKILTKKPLTAVYNEIVSNPRARSAKLRAAAKIKTKKKGS